jgi:hypothetical protein
MVADATFSNDSPQRDSLEIRDRHPHIYYAGKSGSFAMAVIEIPDDQASALKAKAAEQGLTLKAWLGKLAQEESPTQKTIKDRPWDARQARPCPFGRGNR